MLSCLSCERKELPSPKASILGSAYAGYSAEDKKAYLYSILDSIRSDGFKPSEQGYLFEIAAEFYYLKDSRASLKVSRSLLRLAKNDGDSLGMGRALYYIGDCYEQFQKDSAYYYYKESETVFRLLKNDEKTARPLFNKAHLLFTEGNYIESEIEVAKALQKLGASKNHDLLYKCYYLQACNHTELDELDNAIRYLGLADSSLENLKKQTGDPDGYTEYGALLTIAFCNIYDKKAEYGKSTRLLKKLLTEELKHEKPQLYSAVLGNLAYSNMKSGNYAPARKEYLEAIGMARNNNDSQGYLFKIINYGELHLLTRDTLQAVSCFKKALPMAQRLKLGSEVLKSLNFLSLADPGNAAAYKSRYVRVSDSIVRQQRLNSEKFSRIEYETSKVADSNRILSTRNLLLVVGLLATVTLSIIVILLRNRIARKKEIELLKQKDQANDELFSLIKDFEYGLVEAREEEKLRISKELHDGIVNQIYAIRMVLETLNEKSDMQARERRIFYLKDLNRVESEIRNLSHDLNAGDRFTATDFNFLLDSLINLNNEFSATRFVLHVDRDVDWNSYSSVVKVNLYRVLQEFFFNVNKHAKAESCVLAIEREGEGLKVGITDDGVGYDVRQAASGIGHKNVLDRLKRIGAELAISAAKGKGCKIVIRL